MVQHGPKVDVGFIAAPARDPGAGQRRRGRGDGGRQLLELGVEGPVAREELRLAHVEELEVLLEHKEVFGPVVAGQGRGDLVGRGLAVRVAVLGEDVGVALAGDEGAEDREPGLADDVADDAREQQVHLDEGFLHPLDIGAGGLDEDVAVTHERAQGEDRPGGAEAPAQQADTVQLPQPLAILNGTARPVAAPLTVRPHRPAEDAHWNDAFYRKDVAFIEDILADEFVATYDDGSRGDKAKELALAAEFNQQVESAIQDEFTVKVYRDTAVVWFALHVVGIRQGQRAEVTLRYTDVWVLRAGRWQCVSTQSTRVNPR